MKYTWKQINEKSPVLTAAFEDEAYSLLNAFLLAEIRNFGSIIEQGLSELAGGTRESFSFSGNIYSLAADPENAVITDVISPDDISLTVSTQELYGLITSYREETCRLREQIKMNRPSDGGGDPNG